MESTTKAVAAVVGVIVLVIALVVACYLGGWWVFADSTKRESEIRRTTFNYQQTTIDQAVSKATEITTIDVQITNATPEQQVALRAQRKAIVSDTCELIGKVNGTLPPALVTFNRQECS